MEKIHLSAVYGYTEVSISNESEWTSDIIPKI